MVRLRLIPAGLSEHASTWLEMAFSKKDGLPVAWESRVGGKLTGRMRFASRVEGKDGPQWQRAVLEDAEGKELVRWELVEAQGKAKGIPPLTEGWDGYVQLDRRADKPAVDPALHRALGAVREMDWPGAVKELNAAAKEHPGHPLLELLWAWCFEHDPRLGDREHKLGLLRKVAAGQSTALTRFIAEGNFASLKPGELYAILLLQPEHTRTAGDCDGLTGAALAAGQIEQAFAHAEAALARKARDGRGFAREKTRVEILLRLGRADTAVKAAVGWAARSGAGPDQLATMAELLAQYAQSETADALFTRALAAEGLSADARYGLLHRWADVCKGIARWEKLLEAAAGQPAGSDERRACVQLVVGELTDPGHAEVAGRMSAGVKDPELKAALLVRRAELLRNPDTAAEVVWQVHQVGRLPEDRLNWACATWSRAGQPERVIAACEAWLRRGKPLSLAAAAELAAAYRTAGREQDARRADTRDQEPVPPTPAPFGGRGTGMF